MFEAKVRADILKEMVNVVTTLVDEIKLNVSGDGIQMKAVDPAHVAMVDMTLKASAFKELKADKCELGVDIDKLKEVLKLARPDLMITIQHDEDKNNLILTMDNITRRMSLVDTTGMSDPKVPSLNLPAKVTLNVDELSQGIRASESISDHITLIASPDYFELMSEGETDSVNLKVPKKSLKSLEVTEASKSLFSLDYFSNIVKAIGAGRDVNINLGTNYPVKIEFAIAEGEGHVVFLLAPRIENE